MVSIPLFTIQKNVTKKLVNKKHIKVFQQINIVFACTQKLWNSRQVNICLLKQGLNFWLIKFMLFMQSTNKCKINCLKQHFYGCSEAKPAHNDTNYGVCCHVSTKFLGINNDNYHSVEWMHRIFHKIKQWFFKIVCRYYVRTCLLATVIQKCDLHTKINFQFYSY